MFTTNVVSLEHRINKFLLLDQQMNDGQIVSLWPAIHAMCYPFLAHKHLRDSLIIIVLRGWQNKVKPNAYHFVEIFAGCANLSLELLRGGYRGSAFDIVFESCHNALSRSGLRLLLDAVTSIREGGLVWIATQCSSWVVLCRHQSQRCEANGFLGCQRPFVVLGNNLMMISCILFWVAHLVGLHVVLEQPSSSVMPLCRPMRTVLEVTCSRRFNTYMGSFNGPSVKPLQLWSQWSKVALLEREKPVGMVAEPLVQHHGDHQFTGFKDKLAESQQYTCEFGQAVMEICRTEWSD